MVELGFDPAQGGGEAVVVVATVGVTAFGLAAGSQLLVGDLVVGARQTQALPGPAAVGRDESAARRSA